MKKLLAILLCLVTIFGTTQLMCVAVNSEESISQTEVVKPGKVVITEYKKTASAVKLIWKKLSGDVTYKVYIYNNKAKKFKVVSETKKNYYTIKNLEPSTTYKFAVRAYVENEGKKIYGKESDTLSVKTKALATPSKLTGVKITNGGKSKQLKISWKKADNVTGYQVYRSTTGKTGSYKKIASLKNSVTSYTDKNLKNSTTYYYAVRAYNKAGSTIKYGSFTKIYGSTKLTNSFVVKRFNETVRVCNVWMNINGPEFVDYRDSVIAYSKVFGYNSRYNRINHKTINTKKKLKNYLSNYLSESIVEKQIDSYYIDKNGKLYILESGAGDAVYMSLSETTAKIVSNNDKKCVVNISVTSRIQGESYIYRDEERYTMVYEKGKWVFDQADIWTINLWYYSDTIL